MTPNPLSVLWFQRLPFVDMAFSPCPTRCRLSSTPRALLALLSKALDDQEVRHLANDRFRSDLRGLQARVKAELEERSGRKRLRPADTPDGSVTDD